MNVVGFKVSVQGKIIFRLMLISSLPLLAPGCGKKAESAGASTPPVSAAPSAPGVQPGGADMESTLRELTQAVRKYSVEQRKVPRTFSEVVAAGYVQPLPAAPSGKRFEIDSKTRQVVLVNQ